MSLRSSAGGPFLFLPTMWFPDLTAEGTDERTAFVVLAWAELFGERTPDTYKVRLNDTLSLVTELAEVSRHAAVDSRWASHLVHVVEELKAEAKTDPILALHYPHLQYAVESLDKGIGQERAARFAEVAVAELRDYGSRVGDHFRQSLAGLPKAKENVLTVVRKLATRAVQQGLTPDECRQYVDETSLTLSPADAGAQIIDRMNSPRQPWTCIVGIVGETADVATLIYGTKFKQLPNRRKPLGHIGTEFLEKVGESFLAVAEVEARSPTDALQSALGPLRLVLDVANFNHRSAPFRLAPFVYLESGGGQRVVALDSGPYGGLEPQRDATDSAAGMQRDGVLARLPERIVTALEQHSVAHASSDPKVRFVNLWVALETLVGHERDASIIDHILRSVVPMIAHRRVHKIITYLAISMHEFGFCDTVADTTGWFRRSTRHQVRRDELLLALTGAAGAPVHDELAKLTAGQPLLCNRLYTVHRTVVSPAELARALSESKKRTEWQLRRIYRARNLLVHAGSPVALLPHLTANLEYYYSLILSRLLHDLARNANWSIEASFEHRRIQFEYLHSKLERDPCGVTVSDVLQQGAGPLGGTQLWPTPAGAPPGNNALLPGT